jgi:hypothetical protein
MHKLNSVSVVVRPPSLFRPHAPLLLCTPAPLRPLAPHAASPAAPRPLSSAALLRTRRRALAYTLPMSAPPHPARAAPHRLLCPRRRRRAASPLPLHPRRPAPCSPPHADMLCLLRTKPHEPSCSVTQGRQL